MKNFLKYYWLEEYLEREVRPFFEEKGYLTAEQFFAIIEWKNPRFGKTKLSYMEDKDIRELTKNIGESIRSKEQQLEILLRNGGKNRKGIRLATASAILTILYPDSFTVYDIRVRKQLAKNKEWKLMRREDGEYAPEDITGSKDEIGRYINEYIPKVSKVGQKLSSQKLSLRDCDRFLWAKDWYEDLQDFLYKRK